jgi:hypothetical protein
MGVKQTVSDAVAVTSDRALTSGSDSLHSGLPSQAFL